MHMWRGVPVPQIPSLSTDYNHPDCEYHALSAPRTGWTTDVTIDNARTQDGCGVRGDQKNMAAYGPFASLYS